MGSITRSRLPIAALLAALAPAAAAQSLDFARTDYPAGAGPSAVAAADFDQDAAIDLAVADTGTNRVVLLLGQGGGALGAPQIAASVGPGPRGMVAADLDGDGWDDLALASYDSGSVSLLRNTGGGAFAPFPSAPVLPHPRWIVGADLDQDGDLDLATPNDNEGSVSVLLANGDGTFAPVQAVPLVAGLTGRHMDTGDLDLDGDVDLAVGVWSSFSYVSLMNAGAGTSWITVHTGLGLGSSDWVSIGTLDADAFPDVVISANDLGDVDVAVFPGDGTGAVTHSATAYFGCCENQVHDTADLDGDGRMDVALAFAEEQSGTFPEWLTVFRSLGSTPPTFQYCLAQIPGRASDLEIADLDLDGRLDLAVACPDANEVAVFLQRTPVLPSVASTTPATVVSLQPSYGSLELLGSGFTTLKELQLDGIAKFGLAGIVVHDDTRVSLTLPNPVSTGPSLAVHLVTTGGSTTVGVPLVAPPQPILYSLHKFSKSTTWPDLHVGAGAGDIAFLCGSTVLLPSSLPGLVDLSIGNGFASLVYLGPKPIPASGWVPVHLNWGGLHLFTPLHFQTAVLPLGGTLPLVPSNVVSGTLGF